MCQECVKAENMKPRPKFVHRCECGSTLSLQYQVKERVKIHETGNPYHLNWLKKQIPKLPEPNIPSIPLVEVPPPDKSKEMKKAYNAEYYQKNREKLKEKRAEYYRVKQKEYMVEYYQENREKILKKGGEKIVCRCGAIISKSSKYDHIKSKKHLSVVNHVLKLIKHRLKSGETLWVIM